MKDLHGCSVIENNIVGNSMTINMSCNLEGMKATLTGKVKSEGEHGEGQMNMSIQMPGMNMSIDLKWLAKRVGD